MNFLELVQKVDELSLIQGTVDSVTPSGGFQKSMVAAVKRANHDIHLYRKDWLFNYTELNLTVDVGTNSYTPTTIRNWEGVVYNNRFLPKYTYPSYLTYDWTQNPGSPSKYTEKPDKTLIFNDSDQSYNVKACGYLLPDTLNLPDDIPRIPEEYHEAIVYKALIVLGNSIYLGNLISEYTQSYNEIIGQMKRDYIPSRNIIRRPIV